MNGLFPILVFNHFVVDWIFQSHDEAMRKSTEPWIRARHCAVYTAGFGPLLWLLHWDVTRLFVASQILFWSHFFEDTYLPIYYWARYIRRVPVVQERGLLGFKQWAGTPLGILLIVAVDQIVHIAFLWPLVWLDLQGAG